MLNNLNPTLTLIEVNSEYLYRPGPTPCLPIP